MGRTYAAPDAHFTETYAMRIELLTRPPEKSFNQGNPPISVGNAPTGPDVTFLITKKGANQRRVSTRSTHDEGKVEASYSPGAR